MSDSREVQTILARTPQSDAGWGLLLVLDDSDSVLCNSPSHRKKPFFRPFAWQGAGSGERNQSVRFTHSLPLQPDLTASRPGTATVGCDRHPGRDESLQKGCFRRVPFLLYFPCSPSVTRSVLIPRPAARRVSASALPPSGLRLSENLFGKSPQRTRTKRFSEPSVKAPLGTHY